jgi:hypothetical protein
LRIYTAVSRSYSAAANKCRAAKLAWGVVWPFDCKTHAKESSSEFKSGEYGGQSAENQNSAMAANWFERRRLALNPPKGVLFVRLRPSGPRGPHAVSKALVHVSVGKFAGKNCHRRRKSAAKSARTASFRHLAAKSGLGRHLEAFSS